MARPADPDPRARRALVKAATKLMLANGFAATSVQDVCAEAGLTTGALFHYFPDKEALALAALDAYFARILETLDALRAVQPDPLARARLCLDALARASAVYPLREGCLVGRFTQELAASHPRVRARCRAAFDRWTTALTADLAAASEARRLGAFDARAFAEYVLATLEGALVLSRAQGDCAVVARSLALVAQHLDLVFVPEVTGAAGR